MSLTSDTNHAHDQLKDAIGGLIEAQFRVLQVTQQGNLAFTAALEALTQALSAPRQLITDASGNPVAVTTQPQETNNG